MEDYSWLLTEGRTSDAQTGNPLLNTIHEFGDAVVDSIKNRVLSGTPSHHGVLGNPGVTPAGREAWRGLKPRTGR